jgi:peptidoglycan hydrolase-like protein with peptidoglycan-binding domain
MIKTKTTLKKPAASKAPSKAKQRKKKLIITTLAVGATGILGYFGWQYFKKKKQAKANHADIDTIINNMEQPIVLQPNPPKLKVKQPTRTYTPPPVDQRTDDFPLKKGSKGENVRKLQEALITKYGKSVLPKYGADGDFGSEMVSALKKLGLPATITESTLNVIAQGTTVNPATIGKDLYKAAVAKDYSKTISLLKKMRSVDDYTAANNVFKQERIAGVRQTIVNGLLNVFSAESQKQAIKFEFLRIGLQFDGSKWSLSGIDGLPIVTMVPTSVWLNASESVKVPARMVLGNEVTKRLDYTLFENKGKYFLVQTKTIQYL